MLKYPQVALESEPSVQIWLKLICSRLTSSHKAIWEQSRLILKDASRHVGIWSPELLEMLQDCMIQYAFPAMKTHMDKQRNRDALQLWILILLLMKVSLATDLTTLNGIMHIPETSMRHHDGSLRLMSIEAWDHLVIVFRQSNEWFFKKSVVQLLVRPIMACIEEETLLNVHQAAFITWKNIVSALVQDFNRFCFEKEGSQTAIQESARKWTHWYDEAVTKPLMAIMERRRLKARVDVWATQVQQFTEFTAALWTQEKGAPPNSLRDASGIGAAELVPTGVELHGSTLVNQHLLLASRTHDIAAVTMGASLLGLAFVHQDILSMIQRSIAQAETTNSADKTAVAHLVDTTWKGLCFRLHPAREGADQKSRKLRVRLLRVCLEFAFATSSGAVGSAESQLPSSQIASSQATPSKEQVGAKQGFGIHWQLQLLQPLLRGFQAQDELRSLFVHPKGKLSSCLQSRMSSIGAQSPCAARILEMWDSDDPSQERIDLFSRANVLSCTLIYLLLEYSTLLNADRVFHEKLADFYTMRELVACVIKCQSSACSIPSRLNELAQFTEGAVGAAKELLEGAVRADIQVTGGEYLCCFPESSSEVEAPSNPALHEEIGMASAASVSSPSGVQPSTPPSQPTSFPASADLSLPSPCLLESVQLAHEAPEMIDVTVSEDPGFRRPSTERLPPTTSKKEQLTVGTKVTGTPSRARPPLSPGVQSRSRGSSESSSQCIFPELLDSTEPISSLYRHFPLAFRPFFSFYKIKTIGDLSATTIEKVNTFGIKDPVITVTKALEAYSRRRTRLKNIASSPFRQRVQSPAVTPMSPALIGASPSPRRILKGGAHSGNNFASPLPSESPHRKRARRSLLELSSELDEVDEDESETTRKLPKLAERVTFCLPTGDGEVKTCITRPGEDSQDPNADAQATAKEDSEEKKETSSLKFLQHLRRSADYVDKLVAEDESLQSEASQQTSAGKLKERFRVIQEAHDLVEKMNQQLHAIIGANAARSGKLLQTGQDRNS